MKLIDLCKKYDLSEEAYSHLKEEVNKTRKGMSFSVMRDWVTYDYFIFKNYTVVNK